MACRLRDYDSRRNVSQITEKLEDFCLPYNVISDLRHQRAPRCREAHGTRDLEGNGSFIEFIQRHDA